MRVEFHPAIFRGSPLGWRESRVGAEVELVLDGGGVARGPTTLIFLLQLPNDDCLGCDLDHLIELVKDHAVSPTAVEDVAYIICVCVFHFIYSSLTEVGVVIFTHYSPKLIILSARNRRHAPWRSITLA